MKRKDTLGPHATMSIVEDQDEIDNLIDDNTPITQNDLNPASLKLKNYKFPDTF